jgi:hypothetical protein
VTEEPEQPEPPEREPASLDPDDEAILRGEPVPDDWLDAKPADPAGR